MGRSFLFQMVLIEVTSRESVWRDKITLRIGAIDLYQPSKGYRRGNVPMGD